MPRICFSAGLWAYKPKNTHEMEKQVIYIDKPETNERPVEFTHVQGDGSDGWIRTILLPDNYVRVIYLGKCAVDGDLFAAYDTTHRITIFKGCLNSGRY